MTLAAIGLGANLGDAAATLREAIADHGFAEQRVLNWLYQATKGQVSRLEQLPLPMLTTLHKKLGQWADAAAAASSAGHHN